MTAVSTVAKSTGFEALALEPSLLAILKAAGFRKPTPIQAAFIPRVLAGRDVVGQAQTGTGKTGAFLLPFLNRWRDRNLPGPQALIMVPTRELAIQVVEEARKLTPDPRCKTVALYGGQRISSQLKAMKEGYTIAVGTPGRVLDHLARRSLVLDRVSYVVLDEADRMLDIGFRPDIERILRRCPTQRQTLLLSATMPAPVLRLAQRYMHKPLLINLAPKQVTVANIHQTFFTVDADRKLELLIKVMQREQPRQCIIFCRRKVDAQRLFKELHAHVKAVAVMHGDLDQPLRERIMKRFREGVVQCLVATDVVGRGIDVTGISHIINYDLPEDPENYVHRIGRTGRMGKDGRAIAFVTREQGEELTRIEQFINQVIEEEKLADFEAVAPRNTAAAEQKQYNPVYGDRRRRYSRRL